MFKPLSSIARVIFACVISTAAMAGLAQEKIEGVVTSTKLTMCSFKPGGCAGSLVLEVQRDKNLEQVAVKVPLGTHIKKGDEHAYLPALRGNMVSISHIVENGEKVAKSIDVIKPAKP
jgi:hypothetical protein